MPRERAAGAVRVAYQGEPGAYSEDAVGRCFPDAEPLPCPAIADAFHAVAAGATLLGGIPQHGTTLGNASAPVTLVEFADPQCPYCGLWERNALPDVIDHYVRTGKVRIVFNGLAFVGPDSETALRTALAAASLRGLANDIVFQVGLLTTIEFLPFIFLSLPAGVWVDRLRRRPILIVGDLGRGVAIASIPVAFALDGLTIWQLYVVGFVNGCLTVFFDVAYQSYLPSLVEREQIVEGNSKLQTTVSVANVSGPGLAGVLIGKS